MLYQFDTDSLSHAKAACRPPCGGRGLKLESYIKTAENSP